MDSFETSLTLFVQLLDVKGVRVVHGKAMDDNGSKFDHGWVEIEDLVLDFSHGSIIACSRQRFYKIAGIDADEVIRYTGIEAAGFVQMYDHSGPWCENNLHETSEAYN